MNIWLIVLSGVLAPLAVAEVGEISPWLAKKLVGWGARRIGDPERSERYTEEWAAGLEATPGKLTKLLRAISIVTVAVPRLHWAVRKNAYRWPIVRIFDWLLALTCPPLSRRLRKRRLMRFTIHFDRGSKLRFSLGALMKAIESATAPPRHRWMVREESVVEGKVMITVDNVRRRTIMSEVPILLGSGEVVEVNGVPVVEIETR